MGEAGEDSEVRAQIAASARAILERNQWRHLKLRTVIREADVSARRFYGLFANEADLAVFLLEQDFETIRTGLVSALEEHPVGWSGIERFVAAYLEIFLNPGVENQRRYYHAQLEQGSAQLRFTTMRSQVLQPLERALEEAKGLGEISVDDPVADAHRAYNVLEGIIYSVLWAERDDDPATLTDSVQSFLRRAFGAKALP